MVDEEMNARGDEWIWIWIWILNMKPRLLDSLAISSVRSPSCRRACVVKLSVVLTVVR